MRAQLQVIALGLVSTLALYSAAAFAFSVRGQFICLYKVNGVCKQWGPLSAALPGDLKGPPGPPGPIGPAGPAGPAGISATQVVDSRGQVLGQEFLSSSGDFDAALISINGIWIRALVTSTGIDESGVTLVYTASDCSGTGYLQTPNPVLSLDTEGSQAGIVDHVLYYPNPTTLQNRTIVAYEEIAGDGSLTVPCSPDGSGSLQTSAPLTFNMVPFLSKFTPPFSLK